MENRENIFIHGFFVMKNTENTKFREQKQFSEKPFLVFSVFSKTVLNNFQKHEPNRPLENKNSFRITTK